MIKNIEKISETKSKESSLLSKITPFSVYVPATGAILGAYSSPIDAVIGGITGAVIGYILDVKVYSKIENYLANTRL